jgi:hypothetical protein
LDEDEIRGHPLNVLIVLQKGKYQFNGLSGLSEISFGSLLFDSTNGPMILTPLPKSQNNALTLCAYDIILISVFFGACGLDADTDAIRTRMNKSR